MTDSWPIRYPGCNAALLIDAPLNFLAEWTEIRQRYGFNSVALGGGWESCDLEHSTPLDSDEAARCDAIYVGDVITSETGCPRCQHPIWMQSADGKSSESRV